MACFVELKFKDNTTDIAGGERIFLLPVIDKDVNLTVDDIIDLIMENGDEELKSFIPQLKSRYDTIDAIMERGKINVSSISSINSSIDASFIRSYISSPTVGGLLDFCMSKLNIGNNIHIANAEIVNWDGKACDGVLIRQGSLKKIQIDSKVNVTSDSFGSIVSDANFQNILGHELMHYIADDKLEELDVNSIEYKTIDSIYNKFKEEYRKKDSDLESNINKIISEVDSYEGVRKLQEFFANAVGNNEVRTEMSNMRPIERTKENKTLLDSFVNWLSKLVFGENIEPSLMSDLLSVTSGLFDMNKSFFGKDKKNSIVLNNEQKNVVNKAVEFIKNGDPSEFFTIEGKAGTGKTTIAERIVNEFPNKRVYVASLSNKAKNVIKDKFLKSGVDAEFYSLAGLLGQKLDLETGIFNRDEKENDEIPIEIADLILIDESSMVNEQALEMIFQFKKKEAKVLFLGDIGQLPPIRTLKNPYYMDKQYLFEKKSPTFNTKNKGSLLTRVRQGEASPILPFADLFWENSQVERPLDNPAPISSRSNIVTENGALLFTNSFSKIKDSVLDSFKKAIESNNPNHIKVVTYKNDTRIDINSFIHKSIFGVNSPEFNPGELLIFNDHFHRKSKPIENSTEVQIRNINRTYTDGDFLNITEIDFLLDNVITTIPIISSDSKQRYKELISMKFYEAFALKGTDKESYLRALRSAWDFKKKYADVDYAYAITSHKSQGSTYDIVVVDEKDINSVGAISAKTKSESIYTALTRSRNVSIVISSLKVDDVDINTEDLNSNINKLKNNERNIGLSQPQQQSTEIAKTEKESLIYSNYINISEYTNHSGGAIGSDSEWDNIGKQYGLVNNNHYWYGRKNPKSKDSDKISESDFKEGVEKVKIANIKLNRKPEKYMNLLARNWSQVKYSDAIFAISTLTKNMKEVNGGTGWAVQMAIDSNKPVYVFDQDKKEWYTWSFDDDKFVNSEVPVLTRNFAGIGTREINENGKNAIIDVYEKSINQQQHAKTPTIEGESVDDTLEAYHDPTKIKGSFTGQDSRVEFEIKGDSGKEFLITINRNGRIDIFSEKTKYGTYIQGDEIPKESIIKLYNKYIPQEIRSTIVSWNNAFKGSWASIETEDGKNYENIRNKLNEYFKNKAKNIFTTAPDQQQLKKTPTIEGESVDDTTGVKSYNEAENATKDDQLQIPFSKEMSLKSSPENNMSQLSYFSTLLEEKYGVKINLMNSSQIAKELDTNDSTYSRHRAFILDNQIYINVDKASVAEPLHEMGHIVLSALKYSDYDLYEVLLHSIQSHPSYDMIAKHYKELEGVSLDEEVFVTVFGEHYRKVARSEQEVAWHNSHESLFDRIIESVKNFFSNLFGVNIELPAEQFIKLPMEEVLTKFGDMLVKGRFADVNVNVLMSKELEGLKRKLINEGILTQMC